MSDRRSFYITTAIDYANGAPHMGHAFEKIGADAMARYRRLAGEDVHFLMGMDEHGLKVLQSAEAAGVTPAEWVGSIAAQFEAMWQRLSISHDDFIRTTEPRHERAATELVRRIRAAGDFRQGRYGGWYCVGCEAFKKEDELETGPDGVRRCPDHPNREVTWSEEENWFFLLSRYQDRLLKLYDERPLFIQPASRYNEVRNLVEAGLDDVSVSRALPWGIPWPDDGGQTIYVWFEALMNYLSATGFPDPGYERRWPAAYHVIGKDITRFHCVIWPAMLMSAGIDLPEAIWAHGFFTFAGRKLSKSEGVRVELSDVIDRYGPDAFRYYILREVPWGGDGEFTWDRYESRYTADLADDLGNLANRVLSMIERYRGGIVPSGEPTWLDAECEGSLRKYRDAMDVNLLHLGAGTAMELAVAANGFVEARAPWAQSRDEAQSEALDATLATLARTLVFLATMLEPFMPVKMRGLASRLGVETLPYLDDLGTLELAGRPARRVDVLFPKDDRAGA